jgi:hypothetical protein
MPSSLEKPAGPEIYPGWDFRERQPHRGSPVLCPTAAGPKIGLRAEHERSVLSNYHNSNLLILREFFLTLSASGIFLPLDLVERRRHSGVIASSQGSRTVMISSTRQTNRSGKIAECSAGRDDDPAGSMPIGRWVNSNAFDEAGHARRLGFGKSMREHSVRSSGLVWALPTCRLRYASID